MFRHNVHVISRKKAKSLGMKFYFTGKSCKHGHVSERYTGNGNCVSCSMDRETSEYKKQYYNLNKNTISDYKKRYYKENKGTVLKT